MATGGHRRCRHGHPPLFPPSLLLLLLLLLLLQLMALLFLAVFHCSQKSFFQCAIFHCA